MTEAEAREEEERTGWPVVRYRTPVAFDVFEPDGTYLGIVRTPSDFRLMPEPVAREGYLWAVVRNELDVPSIVRFRLDLDAAD